MNWKTATVAAALLASAATTMSIPTQASDTTVLEPQPHGPISIEGNEDFEQPAAISGVRSGNGSIENPYVISDWIIEHASGVALTLRETNAHVVVENVFFPDAASPFDDGLILLQAAENVILRDVRGLGTFGTGLDVRDASNVSVDGFKLSPDERRPGEGGGALRGIVVQDSEDVTIQNTTLDPVRFPFDVRGVLDLHLERSTIVGVDEPARVLGNNGDLALERNVFDGVPLLVEDGHVGTLELHENAFRNTDRIQIDAERPSAPPIGRLVLCGNTFEKVQSNAVLALEASSRVLLRGNAFQHVDPGLVYGPIGLLAEHNLVDAAGSSLYLGAKTPEVHQNRLLDGTFKFAPGADVRNNWWGHAQGPNVTFETADGVLLDRNSPGSWLNASQKPFPEFDPWLEEPPSAGPSSVDCAPGQGLGAAEQEPVRAYGPAGLGPFPITDETPRPAEGS